MKLTPDYRSALPAPPSTPAMAPQQRISSRALLQDQRVLEIDHDGRIYQLRLTQLNKLILTA